MATIGLVYALHNLINCVHCFIHNCNMLGARFRPSFLTPCCSKQTPEKGLCSSLLRLDEPFRIQRQVPKNVTIEKCISFYFGFFFPYKKGRIISKPASKNYQFVDMYNRVWMRTSTRIQLSYIRLIKWGTIHIINFYFFSVHWIKFQHPTCSMFQAQKRTLFDVVCRFFEGKKCQKLKKIHKQKKSTKQFTLFVFVGGQYEFFWFTVVLNAKR